MGDSLRGIGHGQRLDQEDPPTHGSCCPGSTRCPRRRGDPCGRPDSRRALAAGRDKPVPTTFRTVDHVPRRRGRPLWSPGLGACLGCGTGQARPLRRFAPTSTIVPRRRGDPCGRPDPRRALAAGRDKPSPTAFRANVDHVPRRRGDPCGRPDSGRALAAGRDKPVPYGVSRQRRPLFRAVGATLVVARTRGAPWLRDGTSPSPTAFRANVDHCSAP